MHASRKPQFNHQRIDLRRSLPLDAPLVIYIESSSHCNLECRFCPQHISPSEINKQNMTLDLFEKFLRDLEEFPNKIKLLRFCGLGDSLFNKDFCQILKLARKSKKIERLELITNGLLINDKIIPILAENLDRIIISIEGLNSEDYYKYALRKINFETFVDKIKCLYAYPNRYCKIHIKIHNNAVLSDCKKDRFYKLFNLISDEIYIENLVNLWPEVESNLGINNGHRFTSAPINKNKVCVQIFKSMQINSDGSVLPCCIDWKGLNKIGNLNTSTLKEIWNGVILRDLRVRHLNGEREQFSPCKGCQMNEYSDSDNIDSVATLVLEKINNK